MLSVSVAETDNLASWRCCSLHGDQELLYECDTTQALAYDPLRCSSSSADQLIKLIDQSFKGSTKYELKIAEVTAIIVAIRQFADFSPELNLVLLKKPLMVDVVQATANDKK